MLVKHFSDVVGSGDSILASVSINGVSKEIMTSAVTNGSVLTMGKETNVFLPFSKENTSMQTATIRSDQGEATLAYDQEEDAFGYGGEMYKAFCTGGLRVGEGPCRQTYFKMYFPL